MAMENWGNDENLQWKKEVTTKTYEKLLLMDDGKGRW